MGSTRGRPRRAAEQDDVPMSPRHRRRRRWMVTGAVLTAVALFYGVLTGVVAWTSPQGIPKRVAGLAAGVLLGAAVFIVRRLDRGPRARR